MCKFKMHCYLFAPPASAPLNLQHTPPPLNPQQTPPPQAPRDDPPNNNQPAPGDNESSSGGDNMVSGEALDPAVAYPLDERTEHTALHLPDDDNPRTGLLSN